MSGSRWWSRLWSRVGSLAFHRHPAVEPGRRGALPSLRQQFAPRTSQPLSFERLEDRTLLSTITVNSLSDNTIGGNGLVTLREAIIAANTGGATDGGGSGTLGADNIVFASGLTGTLFLFAGEMDITQDLTITGNGAANTIINAQTLSRIFDISVNPTSVTFDGLTLQNGQVTNESGGAIHSAQEEGQLLTIRNSVLTGNKALGTGDGGAVNMFLGSVVVEDSTLTGNVAGDDGGAVCIFLYGDLNLTRCTLSGNTAGGSGGATYTSDSTALTTVTDCTLSGNFASGDFASNDGGGAIAARSSSSVVIVNSTLSGNHTDGRGGAVLVEGDMSVTNSTLSGNYTGSAGVRGFGGGAICSLTMGGNLTIVNSTISGNQILSGSGTPILNRGGGIYFHGADCTIVNSTITNNFAADRGGGIHFNSGDSLTIHNTIFAGNTSVGSRADFSLPVAPGTLFVTRSLIGRSNDTTLTPTSGSTPDGAGNFIGGTTAETAINPMLAALANNGGPHQTHALLPGSLALNSGLNARATIDGQPGSAALANDQRGAPFYRIFGTGSGGGVDMGAFESQALRSIVGDLATFDGTAGNDTVSVNLPTSTVVVNGVSYVLPTDVLGINLIDNGGAGDGVTVIGTTGSDTVTFDATLLDGSLTSTGATSGLRSLAWFDFEAAVYAGAGNNDTANALDSDGSDVFVGRVGQSQLRGTGYVFTALTTRFVNATAESNGGGIDKAFLDGTNGNDVFTASAASAGFNTTGITTFAFEAMQGNALGGTADRAQLNGSTARDVFQGLAQQNQGILSPFGTTNALIAFGFDQVAANGLTQPTNQPDTARLVGKVGSADVLTRLATGQTTLVGTGYNFSVTGFEAVVGTGQFETLDRATFNGTAGLVDTFTVSDPGGFIGTLTSTLGSFTAEAFRTVTLVDSTSPLNRLVLRLTPRFTLNTSGFRT